MVNRLMGITDKRSKENEREAEREHKTITQNKLLSTHKQDAC